MMKNMLYPVLILLIFYALLCAIAYLKQEKLLFYPESLPQNFTFQFPGRFEEHFLNSDDGAQINALLFRCEQAKGVVLYFHGNAGSLRTWGSIAPDFTEKGYDLLLPDYRSYGKSRGKLSERALHDDALLAYDWLRDRYPDNEIIVYGRSLGSGIAVRLAAERSPKMLILESPFYSMADLAARSMPFLPTSLLLQYPLCSDKYIVNVRCPVVLFHGSDDEVVPYDSSVRLADLLGDESVLTTIVGGRHNDLASFDEYQKKLTELLTKGSRPDSSE